MIIHTYGKDGKSQFLYTLVGLFPLSGIRQPSGYRAGFSDSGASTFLNREKDGARTFF